MTIIMMAMVIARRCRVHIGTCKTYTSSSYGNWLLKVFLDLGLLYQLTLELTSIMLTHRVSIRAR